MLFQCICGRIPFEGVILIDNTPISCQHQPIGKIGALIEWPGFWGHLNAYDNLKIFCDLSRTSYSRISDSLKSAERDGATKTVSKYSLGVRQRLAIAQSILEDNPILILDEPMNSLDEDSVWLVKQLLLRLKSQGKTILMASHIGEDIDGLCDTVTYMRDGRVVQENVPSPRQQFPTRILCGRC